MSLIQDVRLRPLRDLYGYFPFFPPASRQDWEKRVEELRRRVLIAAGLWPMPEKTPLQAVIHGRIDRDQYTVEKVYFQSYPGHFVSGNLYRPKNQKGRRPAVLTPHGHWPEGRFQDTGAKEIRAQIVHGAERFEISGRHPLQARCVQLARMGCVVFHYDMVGYADSQQLVHRLGERLDLARPDQPVLCSPQAEGHLQNIFGLQTYNSIRSLDFLSDLPDVDPARIGVTGASGGGTQTMILCAIDPRPAAAFPAVMVSTDMQGGCPCENAPYLRIGTGNIELAGMFAPKPLAMTGADDWTIEITRKGLPELKQLYSLFNAEDRVNATVLAHFPHNYNYVSRAVLYAWFNRHLQLGLEEPIVEEDFQPLSVQEMSVWDEAHPKPSGGPEHERALLAHMRMDARKQLDALAPIDAESLNEYRRVVGGALETMIGRSMPASERLEVTNATTEDVHSQRITRFALRFAAEGEQVASIQLDPNRWNRKVVIWLGPTATQALWTPAGDLSEGVSALLDKGCIVLSADLFGQGTIERARMNALPLTEGDLSWIRYAGYTFGYNSSLFAQRVHDVMSLIAYARGLNADAVDLVALAGVGHIAAAARALVGSAVSSAAIDTAGFRFANVKTIDDPDFLPGGAKYDDLPGLLALSAPHRLWLAGEKESALPLPRAAYRADGRPDHLTVFGGAGETADLDIAKWLTR